MERSTTVDEKEKEGCRKCKSDEGRMETDMALSEFPAFADKDASQPSSHVRVYATLKSALLMRIELYIYQIINWNYLKRKLLCHVIKE